MMWATGHRASVNECCPKSMKGIGYGNEEGDGLRRAELTQQMTFQGEALTARYWQRKGRERRLKKPHRNTHPITCICQEQCCPLQSLSGDQEPMTQCHRKKKKTEKKYLSAGPFLTSALDLFLNKASLIKVISLAVRVLPLILESPRQQSTC